MFQNRWFSTLGTSRKDFLVVFILLFNAFTWYYITILIIDAYVQALNITSTTAVTIWITYYVAVITSSVIGSIISNVKRLPVLYAWMLLGTVSSLLHALPFIPPLVWSFALGFSLGVGLPIALSFFADYSAIENRGRLSGIIFLTFSLAAALLAIAFNTVNLTTGLVLFTLWRGAGLLAFALLKPKENINLEKRKQVSFAQILKDKSLRLYLIPWIIFILIDRSTWLVFGNQFLKNPSLNSAIIFGPIIGSFSAFFGGFLADRIGRKSVVIGGFVSLGLAYALLGIAPEGIPLFWYLYIAVDGIAWGILLATFLLTLWGDLSQFGGREKYYVIGGTPYYFTSIIESVLTSYVVEIPPYATFSLASFFLFLAVIPLLYAPETLPEKKIEIRRLKGYIEQARKIREEYAPS